MNQTFIQRGESIKALAIHETYDVKDLKNKMDYLMKKFEKIEKMRESEENLKTKLPKTKDDNIFKTHFVSSLILILFILKKITFLFYSILKQIINNK